MNTFKPKHFGLALLFNTSIFILSCKSDNKISHTSIMEQNKSKEYDFSLHKITLESILNTELQNENIQISDTSIKLILNLRDKTEDNKEDKTKELYTLSKPRTHNKARRQRF